jgi:hypothetical protein
VQPFGVLARYDPNFSKRIPVVGSGNIDVGNKTPTRKSDRPNAERPTGTDGPSAPRIEAPNTARMKRPGLSGAMSQQCGDSGTHSTPQKFVQLVGCREPNLRTKATVRPPPTKR